MLIMSAAKRDNRNTDLIAYICVVCILLTTTTDSILDKFNRPRNYVTFPRSRSAVYIFSISIIYVKQGDSVAMDV